MYRRVRSVDHSIFLTANGKPNQYQLDTFRSRLGKLLIPT